MPPPISTIQPLAPPALERLIQQCLAKDPDERRQSMHDVLLGAEVDRGGGIAGRASPPWSARGGADSARLAWTLAGAATLAAAAFAVGNWSHRPVKPETVRFEVPSPAGASSPSGLQKFLPTEGLLAFDARDSSGVFRIWVRPLNALTALPLLGTEGTAGPSGPPTAASSRSSREGSSGRSPRAAGRPKPSASGPGGADGSWSQSGVILFDGSSRDSISRVPAEGGEPGPGQLHRSGARRAGARVAAVLAGREALPLSRARGQSRRAPTSRSGRSTPRNRRSSRWAEYSRVEYAHPGFLIFARDRALMAQPFDTRSFKLTGEAFPVADEVFAEAGGARKRRLFRFRTWRPRPSRGCAR